MWPLHDDGPEHRHCEVVPGEIRGLTCIALDRGKLGAADFQCLGKSEVSGHSPKGLRGKCWDVWLDTEFAPTPGRGTPSILILLGSRTLTLTLR